MSDHRRRSEWSSRPPTRWTDAPAAYATWPAVADDDRFREELKDRPIYSPSSYAAIERSAPDPVIPTTGRVLSRADELAIKAARARGLTDPLGAKGFRQTRQRIERETSIRRRVFAASLAIFAACFGLILHSSQNGSTTGTAAASAAANSSVSGAAPPSSTDPTSTANTGSQGAAVIPGQATKTPTATAQTPTHTRSKST